MAEKSTYLKKEGLHVVDEDVSARPGATTNEAIGNDTVYVAFSDGSRATVQKGMIDALNQYGLLDDVKSRDNFNKVVQDVSAASAQQPNSNLAQAHSLFNTKQIAYNDALMQANPQLAQNRLAFVQQNAPDNQAALAAAQAQVDSVALRRDLACFATSCMGAGSSGPLWFSGHVAHVARHDKIRDRARACKTGACFSAGIFPPLRANADFPWW
jgi:hypothetical protein